MPSQNKQSGVAFSWLFLTFPSVLARPPMCLFVIVSGKIRLRP